MARRHGDVMQFFRLFHRSFPHTLAQRPVFGEPPHGVRASLLQSFAAMPSARVDRAPAERARCYFLLAWLHACVLERLRYAPVGWTKRPSRVIR